MLRRIQLPSRQHLRRLADHQPRWGLTCVRLSAPATPHIGGASTFSSMFEACGAAHAAPSSDVLTTAKRWATTVRCAAGEVAGSNGSGVVPPTTPTPPVAAVSSAASFRGLLSSAKKPKKVTPIVDNPLARWSKGMAWEPTVCGCPTMLSSPPHRVVLPIAVGLEGCNKAFNATNAVRTSLFFGACCPPSFLGATSAADILSLQQRPAGAAGAGTEAVAVGVDEAAADAADARSSPLSSSLSPSSAPPPRTMLFGPLLPHPSVEDYAAQCTAGSSRQQRSSSTSVSQSDLGTSSVSSRRWPVVALENYTERCVSVHTARMTDAFFAVAGDGGSAAVAADANGTDSNSNGNVTPKSSSGLCILMGDENKGVSDSRLGAAALVVYVPQYGTISSLNVVTTLGLALFYTWMDLVCPQNRELVHAEGALSGQGDGDTAIRRVLADYFSPFQQDLPMAPMAEAATACSSVAAGASDGAEGAAPFAATSPYSRSPRVFAVSSEESLAHPNEEGGDSVGGNACAVAATASPAGVEEGIVVPWDGTSEWNNIKPGADRIDSRPIHPLFYGMGDGAIGHRYRAFYDSLAALCQPHIDAMVAAEAKGEKGHDGVSSSESSSSLGIITKEGGARRSLASLLPCALYENDFDQRNLGGLIRNANAFMCPTVYYVGKRKINIKGAVGCNHYTPPVYLGKFADTSSVDDGRAAKKPLSKRALRKLLAREDASVASAVSSSSSRDERNVAESSKAADNALTNGSEAAANVREMLAATGRSLWLLSCDHDAFYTAVPPTVLNNSSSSSGDSSSDNTDKYANCYSSPEALAAYARLVERASARSVGEAKSDEAAATATTVSDCGGGVSSSQQQQQQQQPFTVNLTDSEQSIRQKLIFGSSSGGIVLLVPQEGKVPHHTLLDLCVGIVRVLPRAVGADGASSTELSSSDADATIAMAGEGPPPCRGLPSQVASGVALHRILTSCVPCLKL